MVTSPPTQRLGMPRPRVVLVALVLTLVAVGGGARRASGERPAGGRAPEWNASATIGAPGALSVDGLRGRLVLLAFFRTDCGHCRAAVPALNARQSAWFARGVRVVGVTRDPRASVEAYVRDLGVTFPVALVDTEVLRAYDITSFPSLFVLSPDGRIVRSRVPSTPNDGELASLVALTPPLPPTPPSVEPALVALREDRWADAEDGLTACANGKTCAGAAVQAGAAALAWTQRTATTLLTAAEADLTRGEPYEAFRLFDRLARGYGERGVGPQATARRAALLADPGRAREVAAGVAFEAAYARLAAGGASGVAAAVPALDAAAAAFPGTTAATRAAAMATRLRKRR